MGGALSLSGRSRKTIPSAGGILPGGTVIYEQIQHGKNVQYAVYNKEKKAVTIEPFLVVGEHIVYQPLAPSPWLLPSDPIDYGDEEKLWDEVRACAWEHIDMEEETIYDVYTAWVHTTWVLDRFDTTGYLWFHGARNSGKTRALDILNALCFRPLLSPSVSGASVFRALDAFGPTFLLDEFEMYEKQKEGKAEVIGILNAGYRRGQVVLRIEGASEGVPRLKGFNVFGPKSLASIVHLPGALPSRCVRLPMTKAFRRIRTLIDKEKTQELRSKLLMYRFRHLSDELDEDTAPNLPDGRLIEVYWPLLDVTPREETRKAIFKFAQSQYNRTVEEDRATKDAAIYILIFDMLNETLRVRIPQGDLLKRHNDALPEKSKERISKQRLAAILKRLNLLSELNTRTRKQEIVLDPNALERRKNRYVLTEEMERVEHIIKGVRELAYKPTLLDALNQPPPPLQERIEYIVDVMRDMGGIDDCVDYDDLKEAVQLEELDRILELLQRDRRAYRPKPTCWKLVT